MRSRMVLISAVTALVVGVLGCDTDSVVRDLTPTFSGIAFTARADSGATTPISDTVVTQDTTFVVQVDTILAPPDTVLVSVTDTVLVPLDTIFVTDTVINGTDTSFVTDTILAVDTVLVTRTDTTIVVDTVYLPGATDTLVTYDTVVVVEQVPVVPTVATSASSLTLQVGQTVQLGATLENTLGLQATSADITWRSFDPSVAAVTSSGLVSGVKVGGTDVQARDTVRGLFDEIPVNVISAVTEPQVSAEIGGGPHEPLGFTPITERTFSATSEASWWVFDPNANTSIVQDVTAPTGGNALAMRIRFPSGWPGGGEPGKLGRNWSGGFSEIYAAFWFKVSSNWEGHPTAVNKILFILDESFGGAGDPALVNLNGIGSGPLHFEIRQQGPLGARNLTQNVGSVSVSRGSWYFVEVVLRMNTSATSSDGEAHMWINNVKTTEYFDMQWSNTDRVWGETSWVPVWGGIGSTVTNTMYQYMDYIYMSGR